MMDDRTIAKLAVQKILDFQMPTGEWGYYKVDFKDRYLRVKREEFSHPSYLAHFRKPNGYRTLTAMEILKNYCDNRFNSRIARAVKWFKQNMTSGWFVEWDEFKSGPLAPGAKLPHVEKSPDIRHTAQALLVLLKFDRHPGPELQKGLYNILNSQQENGMWPKKPGFDTTPDIFRSVCCADLLFHAIKGRYKKKLTHLGFKEDFFQKARIRLDRTCAWLLQCAEKHRGLWIDEYQTAMVLERLGHWFLADKRYAPAVESAVENLMKRKTDRGWTNSSIQNAEIRESEVYRYETTVRICACLSVIQGEKIWISPEKLQPVLDYLRDKFQPEAIDASDYRYFLHIFYPDYLDFREITGPDDFFDYFDPPQPDAFRRYPDQKSFLQVMIIWIIDGLEKLEMLSVGKSLGVPNYDQAFLEKEEEILVLLETLHPFLEKQPIAEIPLFLSEYFRTGDLAALQKQMQSFYKQGPIPIEKKPSFGKRFYGEARELLVEIIARYLEGMSKS